MTPKRFFYILKAAFARGMLGRRRRNCADDCAPRPRPLNTGTSVFRMSCSSPTAARAIRLVGIIDLPKRSPRSTVVLERVRNKLKLPISLVDFKLAVSAAVLGRSSIMAVSYRDLSSEQAIAVSNALSAALSRYYDEISTSRYNVDVDRITSETQRDQSQKIYANVERQIAATSSRENPFVSSDQSINTLTTQLATLHASRADAYAQLLGDQATAAALAPGPELAKVAHHEILAADPSYVAVRTAAATDTAQLASYKAGYARNFPGLPGAVAKVDSDNQQAEQIAARDLAARDAYSTTESTTIAQRAQKVAAVAGDQAHVTQLDSLIASEQASLDDFPKSNKLYDQLRSERDALQSEYTTLANRRANALANRAEASSLGSVVVLDRARIKADTQLTGGRTRAAILSLILVLALAIGAAFMVESARPAHSSGRKKSKSSMAIPVVARFGARA